MNTSISQPKQSSHVKNWLLVSKEEARLNAEASYCCPNCDGPITVGEHETNGLCNDCCANHPTLILN